ncbi:Protein CBG23559 [Caenorhabditis briggsae]|uniref:Protein CBG23559 n=1 Tax=Caenorhabditis briggsae TaxID=6238 RepID=A8WIU3_CAEBR|nr:Protein CBG23559 [Caenorhabditis briggsae]CAP20386.1 Protein CBG23559 [Caenorhabditis briggsae]
MTAKPIHPIYEATFAETDKTDAILLIDNKKLNVNQAVSAPLLPFRPLQNTISHKNRRKIENVKFQDFATLLSLVQHNPLKVAESNSERLLELSEKFEIPAAKRHVELFLITTHKDKMDKIRIADRYRLDDLLANGVMGFKTNIEFRNLRQNSDYKSYTDKTRVAIFHRMFESSNRYRSAIRILSILSLWVVIRNSSTWRFAAGISNFSDNSRRRSELDSGKIDN